MTKGKDTRSHEALAWRHLYKTARWLRLRSRQLRAEPLCRTCSKIGILTAATVCDHVQDHKGEVRLFYEATNLQSLCATCHDSVKQRETWTGKVRPVFGLDGFPVEE